MVIGKTRFEYNQIIFDIIKSVTLDKNIRVDQAYELLGIKANDLSQVKKSTEEILDILNQYIQDCPNQRFLQISINLGIAEDDLIPWLEESKETYNKILEKL